MKLLIALLAFILFSACSETPKTPLAPSTNYDISSAVSTSLMLQDDITNEELQSDYSAFKSTEMLSIEPLNDTQFF